MRMSDLFVKCWERVRVLNSHERLKCVNPRVNDKNLGLRKRHAIKALLSQIPKEMLGNGKNNILHFKGDKIVRAFKKDFCRVWGLKLVGQDLTLVPSS